MVKFRLIIKQLWILLGAVLLQCQTRDHGVLVRSDVSFPKQKKAWSDPERQDFHNQCKANISLEQKFTSPKDGCLCLERLLEAELSYPEFLEAPEESLASLERDALNACRQMTQSSPWTNDEIKLSISICQEQFRSEQRLNSENFEIICACLIEKQAAKLSYADFIGQKFTASALYSLPESQVCPRLTASMLPALGQVQTVHVPTYNQAFDATEVGSDQLVVTSDGHSIFAALVSGGNIEQHTILTTKNPDETIKSPVAIRLGENLKIMWSSEDSNLGASIWLATIRDWKAFQPSMVLRGTSSLLPDGQEPSTAATGIAEPKIVRISGDIAVALMKIGTDTRASNLYSLMIRSNSYDPPILIPATDGVWEFELAETNGTLGLALSRLDRIGDYFAPTALRRGASGEWQNISLTPQPGRNPMLAITKSGEVWQAFRSHNPTLKRWQIHAGPLPNEPSVIASGEVPLTFPLIARGTKNQILVFWVEQANIPVLKMMNLPGGHSETVHTSPHGFANLGLATDSSGRGYIYWQAKTDLTYGQFAVLGCSFTVDEARFGAVTTLLTSDQPINHFKALPTMLFVGERDKLNIIPFGQ